ncbi:retropepsin-like aspartic protease [Dysgonomonas sp. Marseille-P4361]|uniref:retropepsin-like aspartic protease n=1 Tax=Dysgonomonas sp. Marseille-P4361 TaxID=2161820 RepID=UPI0013597C44|nr:retropepsin-like aspartic protease [Dysgonomonas sp. Marseille-P4361]
MKNSNMIYYKLLLTKRILTLLIYFIPILIAAQEQDNEGRGDEKQEEKSILLQGGAAYDNYYTVVPYDDENGFPVITVEIQEKEYRFIFDTGAPTCVRESLAELLNLDFLERSTMKDAERKVDSSKIFLIDEITIGGILFKGIPCCTIKDDVHFIKCLGIDGIIGSNQMRESIVRFSSKEKTITITDQEDKLDLQSKLELGSELFLDPIQNSPYVWLGIEDNEKAQIQAMFDSGMSSGVFDIALRHLVEFEEYDVFSDTIKQSVGSLGYGFHGKFEDTTLYRFRVSRLWLNNKDVLTN